MNDWVIASNSLETKAVKRITVKALLLYLNNHIDIAARLISIRNAAIRSVPLKVDVKPIKRIANR
jgi:hypothetical protein